MHLLKACLAASLALACPVLGDAHDPQDPSVISVDKGPELVERQNSWCVQFYADTGCRNIVSSECWAGTRGWNPNRTGTVSKSARWNPDTPGRTLWVNTGSGAGCCGASYTGAGCKEYPANVRQDGVESFRVT